MIRKNATAALPLAATLFLGFCVISPSLAQAPPAPPSAAPAAGPTTAPPARQFQPHPIMDVNDPMNKLHLTKDQQEKIDTLTAKFYDDMNALQSNTKMAQADKSKQAQTLLAGIKSNIDALLTPEQRTTRDQQNANRNKYLAARNQAFSTAQADDKLITQTLTPAQKAKINALKVSMASKLKAKIASPTLTPAAKQAIAQQVQASFKGQVLKILTPKQAQAYEDLNRHMDEANSLNRLAQESAL